MKSPKLSSETGTAATADLEGGAVIEVIKQRLMRTCCQDYQHLTNWEINH